MIATSRQLKDKVRNLSHSDNDKAKALIRKFFMERFLERVSLSEYRENFILKGGMFVASVIGSELRATMDIDTTVKSLPLNVEDATKIVESIMSEDIGDGLSFNITSVTSIMDDFEYPGVRIRFNGQFDGIRQPLKIDISTDDVITPSAINYKYRLIFENRSIELLTYTVETVLAEKMQTILSRGIATTRMRDYYDVFEIIRTVAYDEGILYKAFNATCKKRNTIFDEEIAKSTIKEIECDRHLGESWNEYRKANYYVENLLWTDVCKEVCDFIRRIVKNK